jgi:hypothetical protein
MMLAEAPMTRRGAINQAPASAWKWM